MVSQLQGFLEEMDYLGPFKFRLVFGIVALIDDLCHGLDRRSMFLLILLDLLAAFRTIDHGSLLD